ncbi:hypothetical protein NJB1728216S_43450 [Mycobacterium marinum]|nr:hypothetical protein NJB1907f34b_09680 [Mycobacterium marinum]GJO43956.1 hypothetical protein NJB1728e24_29680 [Mycobacterium marinum]GJO58137.1 hypothetical protein NJB1728f10_14720 [Mycobacterium marinum]GJO74045.1 hypothetical protein NJB1907f34a_35650 [Mycobacterium marinum]GJO75174.1 hypothetical protein NJB1728f31_04290 [Mycobacterium marinum]
MPQYAKVSFPMARLGAIGGIEWPLVNRQHRMGEARTASTGRLVGAAMSPSRAQRAAVRTGDFRRSDQVSLGLIDSLIDTFVAQPHRLVIGVFPA